MDDDDTRQGLPNTAAAAAAPTAPAAAPLAAAPAPAAAAVAGAAAHSQSRDYQCPTCPSAFHRSSDLNRHVRTVHEKRKDHVCPYCNRGFGEAGNMNRHVRSRHNVDWQVLYDLLDLKANPADGGGDLRAAMTDLQF